MPSLSFRSHQAREVMDITDDVTKCVREQGVSDGLCHLFAQHTTAALTVMDLDPGTDQDLLDAVQAMVPKLRYRHPHDPGHVPSHILSAVMGPSLTLPVARGSLALGTWQRVVLVEMDGPRERGVVLTLVEGLSLTGQ